MSGETVIIPLVLRVEQLQRAATEAVTGESSGFRRFDSPLTAVVNECVKEARSEIKRAVAAGLAEAMPHIREAAKAAFIKGAEAEAAKLGARVAKAAAKASEKGGEA